jgi:small subunit ribosomal protein S21
MILRSGSFSMGGKAVKPLVNGIPATPRWRTCPGQPMILIATMIGPDRKASRWGICFETLTGGRVVKLTLRDKESAQEAVRRFRKLIERSGIKKEMRVREFYEKPSEIKRRARLRAERRARRDRFMATH